MPAIKGLAIDISNVQFVSIKNVPHIFVYGFPGSAVISAETGKVLRTEEQILARRSSAMAVKGDLIAIQDPLHREKITVAVYRVGDKSEQVASIPVEMYAETSTMKFSNDGSMLIAASDKDVALVDLQAKKQLGYLWGDNFGIGPIHGVNFRGSSALIQGMDQLVDWNGTDKPTTIYAPKDYFSLSAAALSDDQNSIFLSLRQNGTKKAQSVLLRRK
jgi:hypothetical protein